MATALSVRPRASIDDARPVLFYGDEQAPQTTFGRDQMVGRPALKYEPGRPVNGLPGATSTDEMPAPTPATGAPSPVVGSRTVRERPRLSLGDILPQRTAVPNAPTYQKKDKYSVWDRVKSALGGARYNAGGGIEGMIGGAIGGAMHPDQIDEANFVTGPLAQWRRQQQEAQMQDDRNLKQVMTKLQMAKMVADINKGTEPKPLKPLTNSPYLAFYDEDSGEIVMPRVGDEPLPGAQLKLAERNHDWDVDELREKHKLELEELTRKQEWAFKEMGMKATTAKELEQLKSRNRTQLELLQSKQQRERDGFLERGRNARHAESMKRPELVLPGVTTRRPAEDEQ
jgi:hypothetical protein